jgi:tRNA splicing endonuclease
MTGVQNYNRDAFLCSELHLRALGYDVENPWRFGAVDGWGHYEYMRRDIVSLAECDAIYMLSGWKHSRGARKEWAVARWVFGMRRIKL